MKIKRKEKTVRNYTLKMDEIEMTELFNEIYEIAGRVDLADNPRLFDLLDSLRVQIMAR